VLHRLFTLTLPVLEVVLAACSDREAVLGGDVAAQAQAERSIVVLDRSFAPGEEAECGAPAYRAGRRIQYERHCRVPR
jgi:hypothetical protein